MMGGTVWALLMLAAAAAAEVTLITEPQDGKDEYVFIKSGSADTVKSPASGHDTKQPGFSTAHSWPEKLRPRAEADDDSEHGLKVRGARQVSYHEGMEVQVTDEGELGALHRSVADSEESRIMARKIDVSKKVEKEKKEEDRLAKEKEYLVKPKEGSKKVQIELEGNSGVRAAPVHEDVDDIAVPQQKFITPPKHVVPTTILPKSHYDIISVNKPGAKKQVTDEGSFDFVDSPLGDKQLISSGSSQASRVNVKKGPNGQDYEYEYVYYYYDEDDELVGPAKPGPVSAKAPHSAPAASPPTRSRQPTPDTAPDTDQQELAPSRGNGRNRYTTIERTRPTGPEASVDSGTTPEPASNEVLPQTTRGSNRIRGSQRVVEAQVEERLPANTRFPPRSRANSVTTQPPPPTDTPITRIRGSVRRPSLELVDSSSFRTHASDVSPDQDHSQLSINDQEILARGQRLRPSNPAAPDSLAIAVVPPSYSGNSYNSYSDADLEERFATSTTTTTTAEPQTHTTTTYLSAMTDKAAFDLYALLRETENEQSNLLYNEPSTSFEEGETTDASETTPAATTTTVATTTTTTTTTTTPPPPTEPPVVGRGRYRGGVAGRNKFRTAAASTTATTPSAEAADDATTKRAKFSPNRSRDSNQVSSYGRRGSKTTPSPDQSSGGSVEATSRSPGRNRYRAGSRNSPASTSEAPATSPASVSRPSFGSDRFNSRRRGGSRVTTAAPAPVSEAEAGADSEAGADDSTSVSSTVRPSRPRLSIGGVRPLRPGPRINIGGRPRPGAAPTTPANVPPSEEPAEAVPQPAEVSEQSEPSEQTAETTTSQPDALTRLRNRPRLHVGAKAKPVSSGGPPPNRRNLVSGLLPRRRAETSTESTVATEDARPEEEEAETVATVLSTTEPSTTQDRLSSLVSRRRLPGRRLPRPTE